MRHTDHRRWLAGSSPTRRPRTPDPKRCRVFSDFTVSYSCMCFCSCTFWDPESYLLHKQRAPCSPTEGRGIGPRGFKHTWPVTARRRKL